MRIKNNGYDLITSPNYNYQEIMISTTSPNELGPCILLDIFQIAKLIGYLTTWLEDNE